LTTPPPPVPREGSAPRQTPAATPAIAPGERGWAKVILALAAFLLVPRLPHLSALLPVGDTQLLLIPAIAACTLVGWWAGGRILLAAVWVGLAVYLAMQMPQPPDAFENLSRGWALVLAGAFGLVCLFGARRSFFPRSLIALTVSLGLALMMSALGPVSGSHMSRAVQEELTHRNTEAMGRVNAFIGQYPNEWNQWVAKVPRLGEMPAETEKQLGVIASAGRDLFPSLLALQSIAALAIAWAIYHRLSRTRLGPPLGELRDFRFNDQLVWGLIVGLTIMFLPTLVSVRAVGRNLLVFFGALYAVRGLGVLSWFMAPGTLTVSATIGLAMFLLPVLNAVALLGFFFVGIAAFGLGLGDTWADWRSRARSSPST
jgi:hypothetical protein